MAEHKFQLRYSAAEDRILIISGPHNDLRSFALTRHMVRQLWPALNKIVKRPERATNKPASRDAVDTPHAVAPTGGSGEPEASKQSSKPSSPSLPEPQHESNDTTTPPDTYHLVHKLQLVGRSAGTRLLVLMAKDAALRVPLDETQLGQVHEALRTVIVRADWGIDLDEGLAEMTPAAAAQGTPDIDITADSPSRYRH